LTARGPWGFFVGRLARRASPPCIRPTFSCTSKSSCEPSDPSLRAAGCVALHDAALCSRTTEAVRGLMGHTSHEVEHPSDDISAGVRLTRVYLTRHLPPMGFLNPSTVYSSRRFACLVSCRRHMGFKEQEQHHQATSAFAAGADPKAPSHLSTEHPDGADNRSRLQPSSWKRATTRRHLS
jgi:hypothetical protein